MPGSILDVVKNVMGESAALYDTDHPAKGLSAYVFLEPALSYNVIGGAGVGYFPREFNITDTSGSFGVTLPANSVLNPLGSKYRIQFRRYGTPIGTTPPFVMTDGYAGNVSGLIATTTVNTGSGGGTDVAGLYKTFSNVNYAAEPADRTIVQTGTMTADRTVTLPAASAVAAGWPITVADASGTNDFLTKKILVSRAGSDQIKGGIFNATAVLTRPYESITLTSNGTDSWTQNQLPLSVDGSLAANSDLIVPTVKAVKTYVDANAGSGGGASVELVAGGGMSSAVAGGVMTMVNNHETRTARRLTDNSGFTNTTMTSDGVLTVPVDANTLYSLRAVLFVNFPSAADIKYGFARPTGATMAFTDDRTGGYEISTSTPTVQTTGSNEGFTVEGWILTSSTAGSLTVQAAQAASNGTAGKLLTGSLLELTRLA